jgi:hypothetical protein
LIGSAAQETSNRHSPYDRGGFGQCEAMFPYNISVIGEACRALVGKPQYFTGKRPLPQIPVKT